MKYDDRDQLLADAKAAMERAKEVMLLGEWSVVVLLADDMGLVRAETESFPRTRRAETKINVAYWFGKQEAMESEKAAVWGIAETMLHEAIHIRLADLMVTLNDDRLSKETIDNLQFEQEQVVNLLTRVIHRGQSELFSQNGHLHAATESGIQAIP